MKTLFTKIGLISLIFLLPVTGYSQKRLAKANRLYDNLSFATAIPEYQKVLKSYPDNTEALLKIAHCYRLINNSIEAEKWYSRVVQLPGVKPSHIMYYIQAMMSNGKYVEAEAWINKYSEVAGISERTQRIKESLEHINSLVKDSMNYEVERLKINSTESDGCPVYYEDGLVFVSSRKRLDMIQRTHEWTGLPFFSLYFAKGHEKDFEKPEMFAPALHTKFNNGSICFSKDFSELYLTRNNIEDGKIRESDSGVVKLKIYNFKKSGTKWKNETAFRYNSDQYNCAHPFISPDGKRLVFASDMPGGFGGMDLYVCFKEGEEWGMPLNLGPDLNTSSNEGFPFIDGKGDLYFSSDGRGGLGGLDIFYSPQMNGGYAVMINLGYPINSSGDDFGWMQNEDGSEGYFSSNREHKNQNDEIYFFRRNAILLNVLVYDSKTKDPLKKSRLKVFEDGYEKTVLMSGDSGNINFLMTPGKKYQFITEKEKYVRDSTGLETADMKPSTTHNLSVSLEKYVPRTTLKGKLQQDGKNKAGMAGVLVTLTDKETGEVRSAITDAEGNYEFTDVPVEANYSMESRRGKAGSNIIEITSAELAAIKAGENNSETLMKLGSLASLVRDVTKTTLKGRILDSGTLQAGMEGVVVRLREKGTNDIRTTVTDADGYYWFSNVSMNSNYTLDAWKDNYVMLPIDLDHKDLVSNNIVSTNMQLGTTSDILKIEELYYDVNKYEIRPDAKIVLNKLVELMNANPGMQIEMRSHTDCRNTESYNKKLSNKRAKAAAEYLISKGISASRLKSKGYGESMPVNMCECEGRKIVTCTEKQYQQNRRTEFKIISMN